MQHINQSCNFTLAFFSKWNFSAQMAKAEVFPLHKEGSKLDENNYRPVSLHYVYGIIYERNMYNRLYSYLEKFDMIFTSNLDPEVQYS